MASWVIKQKTVDEVKSAINTALTKSTIPPFVEVSWDNYDLKVKIEKGGKSEFRMGLKSDGSDVQISETKRDIAFLHKPFVGKVETVVTQIMSDAGAAKA